MIPVDADAEQRTEMMNGAYGHEAQFQATQARTREVVALRFSMYRFVPGSSVSVNGSEEPFIFSRE